MKRGQQPRSRSGERGVSELLGTVLLVGLVVTGAMVVVVTGLPAVAKIQTDQQDASARLVFQELDERFQSLSNGDDGAQVPVDVHETVQTPIDLKENRGYLQITVNERASCRVNLRLDSLRYESDTTIVYQGGGIWERYPDGSSAMVASPDVTFDDGTLDVAVQNITGTFDTGKNIVTYDQDTSRARSQELSARLVSGPCRRPDNITLEINSRHVDAWTRYLRAETGVADAQITRVDDRTARVRIPQSKLSARTDDDRNHVVNLSRDAPEYMDTVQWSPGGNTITVDKNNGNHYATYVRPLRSWYPSIGRIRAFGDTFTVPNETDQRVVLVLDRSGSMDEPAENGHRKLHNTKEAAKSFVGTLNFSDGDRVALVQYSHYAEYVPIDGQYFSADPAAINATIDTISITGNTDLSSGLRHANAVMDGKTPRGDPGRKIIFLTDGRNFAGIRCDWYDEQFRSGRYDAHGIDPNSDQIDEFCIRDGTNRKLADDLFLESAAAATETGTTLYTVSYGPHAEQALLETAAETVSNGDHYHSRNARQLTRALQSIGSEISTERKMVTLDPISTSVTTGSGTVSTPQIPGDIDAIAAETVGSNRYPNVNDPTAPSQFSHALSLQDGESATISGLEFACREWTPTGTNRVKHSSGTPYPVVRCAKMTGGSALSPSDVRLIRDESRLRAIATGDARAWWQPSYGSVLDDSDIYNATSDSYDLESNQIVVELSFNDTGPAAPDNRLLLLAEIGRAEESTTAADLIDVRVSELRFER